MLDGGERSLSVSDPISRSHMRTFNTSALKNLFWECWWQNHFQGEEREFCHRVDCLFKMCEGKNKKQKNSQLSHVAAERFVAAAGRVCVCVFSRVVGWRGGGVPLLLRQQPQLCNIIWRGVNKKSIQRRVTPWLFFLLIYCCESFKLTLQAWCLHATKNKKKTPWTTYF